MDSKEIVFRNLNISLKQKHVLKNISGVAKSKEVLGVYGPKGKKNLQILGLTCSFGDVKMFAPRPPKKKEKEKKN